METTAIESNTIIISNQTRVMLFYKIYYKTIFIFVIPLLLSPITFMGKNDAYLCFYAFLITATYWILDVLHPAIISLIPIVLSTIMNILGYEIINYINIPNILLDCFGMLMYIVAIENSNVHKRIAIKILLIFGCSHYRLCFLLFFTTTILSMWISNTLACGFMMPIVKAIMFELEKMGILEVYETIEEGSDSRHNKILRTNRPTEFTIFYFVGIAYSSSIGALATTVGSQTNLIFKDFSETLFPRGPKIEFPQFMLLTLPGVLMMETMLYLWMNFYFLGLFRIHSYSALQSGCSEEEAQYVKTLLQIQYEMLGKMTVKEMVVCSTVILCALLQTTTSTNFCHHSFYSSHIKVSAPTILCLLILFLAPTNLDFLKFCKKRNAGQGLDPLPSSSSESCLTWNTLKNEVHWNVLLVIGSSCAMFEALKQSKMTDEFEKFLQIFGGWPADALVLVVVVFCKILTEFACNSCVVSCMLDHVAKVGLSSRVNPYYLMLAGTLSCSLPFHTIIGTPANASVASYLNIPPRRLLYAGIGPTIFSILILWFTIAVWSKVIWPDINTFQEWATDSNLTTNNMLLKWQ